MDGKATTDRAIKKLRGRFVVIAMLVLCVMQLVIVGASVAYSYNSMVSRADILIDSIYDSITSGTDASVDARYFYVVKRAAEKPVVNNENEKAVLPLSAYDAYTNVKANDQNIGFYQGYRYRIFSTDEEDVAVFVQRTGMIKEVEKNALVLCAVSLFGLLCMLVFLIAVSKHVVGPVAEAHRLQKEFISSASHALKTPITVILADAEILDMDHPDNEWVGDIKSQGEMLKDLTNDLVYLAKVDEAGQKAGKDAYSFSELACELEKSYRALEIVSGKKFECAIEPSLTTRWDRAEMRKLIDVLLDNAFKYSPPAGSIYFGAQSRRNKIQITLRNDCDAVSDEVVDRMFDRFYRCDNISSGIAGTGLGLSIAKRIVENCHGEIKARAINSQQIEIIVCV